MATASNFLLQRPIFKFKNHSYHSRRVQSPACDTFANFRIRFESLGVICSLSKNNDSAHHQDPDKQIGLFANMETNRNHFEFVANSIINALKALKKPVVAAVLVGLLLMYDPNSALAAGSGGRMGGSSFSSRSSTSSSSSRSYSAPRSMSEAGSDFNFSFSAPYYAPSPFEGVYVGPAVSVGSSPLLIVIAFVAFILVSGFMSEGSESGSVLIASEKISVLKLQV
ncbi:hypothetical protein OROGR_014099 [Orobanche gracilis]